MLERRIKMTLEMHLVVLHGNIAIALSSVSQKHIAGTYYYYQSLQPPIGAANGRQQQQEKNEQQHTNASFARRRNEEDVLRCWNGLQKKLLQYKNCSFVSVLNNSSSRDIRRALRAVAAPVALPLTTSSGRRKFHFVLLHNFHRKLFLPPLHICCSILVGGLQPCFFASFFSTIVSLAFVVLQREPLRRVLSSAVSLPRFLEFRVRFMNIQRNVFLFVYKYFSIRDEKRFFFVFFYHLHNENVL